MWKNVSLQAYSYSDTLIYKDLNIKKDKNITNSHLSFAALSVFALNREIPSINSVDEKQRTFLITAEILY